MIYAAGGAFIATWIVALWGLRTLPYPRHWPWIVLCLLGNLAAVFLLLSRLGGLPMSPLRLSGLLVPLGAVMDWRGRSMSPGKPSPWRGWGDLLVAVGVLGFIWGS